MSETPFDRLLKEVPEADRHYIALAANRRMNMSPGWRPSDAARAEIYHYHLMGREAYIRAWRQERGIG